MSPARLKILLIVFSFFIVAFGQPVWSGWIGLLAGVGGYACFWRALLETPSKGERFILSMGWFAAVQMVQLGWFASHPYIYIYAVLFFCAYLMGAQFGIIGMFITPLSLQKKGNILAIASLWVFFEWSRLFILSGLSFNPVGLSLTGSLYPLQMAAIGGSFFLSFWVFLTNLFVLRAWMHPRTCLSAVLLAIFPFFFGFLHYHYHLPGMQQNTKELAVLLVQPALPVEEASGFISAEEARENVLNRWKHILSTTVTHKGKQLDLLVLPEYVVPYGTFPPIYPLKDVRKLFRELYGEKGVQSLPALKPPLAHFVSTDKGMQWLVSNAFIVQGLANFFQSFVLAGLEDSVYVDDLNGEYESFSGAFHFSPIGGEPQRYEKRVLVPMGEYIPFAFCRKMAARYGITGSFTAGKAAKVFEGPIPCSATICYEETYGNLMRENRQKGAELLVNLTNDGWYPNSRLPQQHFDHARLRTVENGIPLVRACNTGITGGLNSLGEIVGVLGPDSMKTQTIADAAYLKIPSYHYSTLYSSLGDLLVLSICFFNLLLFSLKKYFL